MKQNYINHIAILLDSSASMGTLSREVVKVFDAQIKNLAKRSVELKQETRVTVYKFNNTVECLVYDLDVLRLPDISSEYIPDGNTALIDGTLKCIEDLKQTATLYGDHSFLVICLTDGQENYSSNTAFTLLNTIKKLPENWTLGVFVPDTYGVMEAKKYGFLAENIQQWNADAKGIQEIGKTLTKITDNYMIARSKGIRGTKSLFNLDTDNLNAKEVKKALTELSARDYMLLPVRKQAVIKDFVESWTKTAYLPGSSYYQLSKPESVQAYKQICIQNKTNGKVYSGTNARQMLGLPNYEVKINPAQHPDFDLFVQSTSLNRKLVAGTKLLVMK